MPRRGQSVAPIAAIIGGNTGAMDLIATGSCVLKQHLTLCAALAVLGVAGIATADAQSYYYYGAPHYYYGAPRPPAYVGPRMYRPGLPSHEILAIVRASGLRPLSQPVRRGPRAYTLVAAARGGERVQVVVDAYAGGIRRVNPIAMRPYGGAPPVAAYPYDPRTRGALVEREFREPPRASTPRGRYDSDATLTPPRSVPNGRVANAPAVNPQTPSVKPEQAPLPRPRPDVAAATPAPEATVPPPAAAPVEPQVTPAPVSKPEIAPKHETPPAMAPVTPLD
jgi:hypothetical protein